jgi:predicted MFS family arabinose efflux permease
MFLPDLAKIMGATGSEAALLISVLGACNTFGRLAAGWLADRQWADCLIIQNVALITGGIATAMVPLFTTYALLAAYCCVFGTCMGTYSLIAFSTFEICPLF